jgi:predicted nucleic acid-binding protein
LGAGESEAISLALELKADVLLMDERKGRREALARGIAVAGTLNILESAAARGLVNLPEAIIRLQRTSFRASPALLREILRRESIRVQQSENQE